MAYLCKNCGKEIENTGGLLYPFTHKDSAQTVCGAAQLIVYRGLTVAQTLRIDAIRDQIASLDKGAREIVKPTQEEIGQGIEMYSDNGSYDLAETMMDSWGSWEDILQGREIEDEEYVDSVPQKSEENHV